MFDFDASAAEARSASQQPFRQSTNKVLHTACNFLSVCVRSIAGLLADASENAFVEDIVRILSCETPVLSLTGKLLSLSKVYKFAHALEGNCTLKWLQLDNNCLGDEAAARLANVLQTNTTLESLDLDCNLIGDDGASHIAEVLKWNCTLQTLELHCNAIGSKGGAALGDALLANTTLRTLGLDYNFLGDAGATKMADGLEENRYLRQLLLGANRIGNAGASQLGRMLGCNRCLHELHVNGNMISDSGVAAIANALKYNNTLSQLWLQNNMMGQQSIEFLAEALEGNCSLSCLGITSNRDIFLTPSMEALRRSHTLRRAFSLIKSEACIKLDGHNLGDAGAARISHHLESTEVLKEISLAGCCIGDKGATKLADAIEKCNSLARVSLIGNRITDLGASRLIVALQRSTSLEHLELNGNKISKAVAQELEYNLACIPTPRRELSILDGPTYMDESMMPCKLKSLCEESTSDDEVGSQWNVSDEEEGDRPSMLICGPRAAAIQPDDVNLVPSRDSSVEVEINLDVNKLNSALESLHGEDSRSKLRHLSIESFEGTSFDLSCHDLDHAFVNSASLSMMTGRSCKSSCKQKLPPKSTGLDNGRQASGSLAKIKLLVGDDHVDYLESPRNSESLQNADGSMSDLNLPSDIDEHDNMDCASSVYAFPHAAAKQLEILRDRIDEPDRPSNAQKLVHSSHVCNSREPSELVDDELGEKVDYNVMLREVTARQQVDMPQVHRNVYQAGQHPQPIIIEDVASTLSPSCSIEYSAAPSAWKRKSPSYVELNKLHETTVQ